jgi:hypothetical protein
VFLEHAREFFPQSVRHGECLTHTRGPLAAREWRKQAERRQRNLVFALEVGTEHRRDISRCGTSASRRLDGRLQRLVYRTMLHLE